MSKSARYTLSRRAALTGVAITAAYGSAVAEQGSDSMSGENGAARLSRHLPHDQSLLESGFLFYDTQIKEAIGFLTGCEHAVG
jgi:hypothetical protein